MVSFFFKIVIRIWRSLTIKVQAKKLDVLGHFVEQGGQAIFSCFSHLLTDLTKKSLCDTFLVTTLNTEGLTLTSDKAEEENRFFIPALQTSV